MFIGEKCQISHTELLFHRKQNHKKFHLLTSEKNIIPIAVKFNKPRVEKHFRALGPSVTFFAGNELK